MLNRDLKAAEALASFCMLFDFFGSPFEGANGSAFLPAEDEVADFFVLSECDFDVLAGGLASEVVATPARSDEPTS